MADFPLLKDMIDRQLVEQIADRLAVVHPAFDARRFCKGFAIWRRLDASGAEGSGTQLGRRRSCANICRLDYPSGAATYCWRILDDADGQFEPISKPLDFACCRYPDIRLPATGWRILAASLDAMPHYYACIRHASLQRFVPISSQYPPTLTTGAFASNGQTGRRRACAPPGRAKAAARVLPWWPQLTDLIANPSPSLALLERLKDDPSLYVRRSVANHLNDIGKDHPELLLERMEAWSVDAGEERRWLINHALRSLVKGGDQRALAILGYGPATVDTGES